MGEFFECHQGHAAATGVANEGNRTSGELVLVGDDLFDESLGLIAVAIGPHQVDGSDALATGPVVHDDRFADASIEESERDTTIEDAFAFDSGEDDDEALVEAFGEVCVVGLDKEWSEGHLPKCEQGADASQFRGNAHVRTLL